MVRLNGLERMTLDGLDVMLTTSGFSSTVCVFETAPDGLFCFILFALHSIQKEYVPILYWKFMPWVSCAAVYHPCSVPGVTM